MQKITNSVLGDHIDEFTSKEIKAGRCNSVSEDTSAALRL